MFIHAKKYFYPIIVNKLWDSDWYSVSFQKIELFFLKSEKENFSF